jgi:hypothetical protein
MADATIRKQMRSAAPPADAGATCDLEHRHSLTGKQNDLRPLHMFEMPAAIADNLLQARRIGGVADDAEVWAMAEDSSVSTAL